MLNRLLSHGVVNMRRDDISLRAVHVAELLREVVRREKLDALGMVVGTKDQCQHVAVVVDRFDHWCPLKIIRLVNPGPDFGIFSIGHLVIREALLMSFTHGVMQFPQFTAFRLKRSQPATNAPHDAPCKCQWTCKLIWLDTRSLCVSELGVGVGHALIICNPKVYTGCCQR